MLVLVRCLSCTHDGTSCEVFLLHSSCFSDEFLYNPDDTFSKVFLLVTLLVLVLVRSFSYTPDAYFSEEFLLYS